MSLERSLFPKLVHYLYFDFIVFVWNASLTSLLFKIQNVCVNGRAIYFRGIFYLHFIVMKYTECSCVFPSTLNWREHRETNKKIKMKENLAAEYRMHNKINAKHWNECLRVLNVKQTYSLSFSEQQMWLTMKNGKMNACIEV